MKKPSSLFYVAALILVCTVGSLCHIKKGMKEAINTQRPPSALAMQISRDVVELNKRFATMEKRVGSIEAKVDTLLKRKYGK